MSTERKILILSFPRARDEKKTQQQHRRITPRCLRLYTLLLQKIGYRFTTVAEALQSPSGKFCCLTFDAVDDHARGLLPFMHSWKIPGTLFIATNDIESPGSLGYQPTWKKLRRLTKWGWEIGTYGRTFTDLTTVSYGEQLEHIRSARETIKERLGRQPMSFAYAFGAYDTSILKILKDQAFLAGLSTTPGINLAHTANLQLQRVRLTGKSLWDLIGILRWSSHKPKVGEAPQLVTPPEGATPVQRSTA